MFDRVEESFRSYVGECDVDERSREVLISLKDYLLPSEAPAPMSYKDIMSFTIACAPKTEWDLWDAIIYSLPYRPQQNTMLDRMVSGVFNYYKDYQAASLVYHIPDERETECLFNLRSLAEESQTICEEERLAWLTAEVYELGKVFYLPKDMYDTLRGGQEVSGLSEEDFSKLQKDSQKILRNFFAMVYSVLLGQSDGPRLPNFIEMMSVEKFVSLVSEKASL